MESKWGYCEFKQRDHQLSDFHSVKLSFFGSKHIDAKPMHHEVCRHCGKAPTDD